MRAVATVGGVGYLPYAPGTWGSAVAVPLGLAIHAVAGFWGLAVAALAAFALGWWSVVVMTRGLADHDLSEIVIDELLGIWIALLPLSYGLWAAESDAVLAAWPGWIAAFVLFRLFDIWKPGPIGWADKRTDPLGVMLDDAIAGVFAAILVAALALAWPGALGF
ncbi:MAG: phosphatidylglycerophosphatase A [Pseudomonadota bacterium]